MGTNTSKNSFVKSEDLLKGLRKGDIFLVDIRTSNERKVIGRIPTSYHIPVAELYNSFNLSNADFEKKYDFPKPSTESTNIILYCGDGKQSAQCCKKLTGKGYHFKALKGGLNEWKSGNDMKVLKGVGFDNVTFTQVRDGLQDNSIIVIDVRRPRERINPGRIPGTYNVQLSEIYEAFQNSDENFRANYKFAKPSASSSNLVLHCLSGIRATTAAEKISLLGYQPKIYIGSFKNWKQQGGEVLVEEEEEH